MSAGLSTLNGLIPVVDSSVRCRSARNWCGRRRPLPGRKGKSPFLEEVSAHFAAAGSKASRLELAAADCACHDVPATAELPGVSSPGYNCQRVAESDSREVPLPRMLEGRGMRVEILSSSDCPNAAAAHELLVDCLAVLGIDTAIVERVGPFPSPSVLIDGTDVMCPDQPPTGDFCRLDLPTRELIFAALRRAVAAES
ncbi:hypothetical protein KV112_11435 [Mycolicibacter sp. MYC123]|nr:MULTISPECIES: hypothetical protein [Mycolicibacter]MEB3050343.1 hypothetical protein [Mycolicibacter sp. MYC123]